MLFLAKARMVSASSSGLSSTSKIALCAIGSPLRGQSEVECSALFGLGIGPDLAAVLADDALDRRQPDTGAGVDRAVVQALERVEELAGILHLETGAVVAHEERLARFGVGVPELDLRRLTAGSELPGIADEVFERDAHQARVALGDQPGSNGYLGLALRRGVAQPADDFRRHCAEIDLVDRHLGPGNPRQLQQVVDQIAHALGALADAVEVALCIGVELVAGILDERLAESVDGAKRGTEVVRNRIAEAFQFLVDARQLVIAFGKVAVEPGDRGFVALSLRP